MAEHKHIADLRRTGPAYEDDYAGWLQRQVGLMQAGNWQALDVINLIDEVESLGRSDFKSFVSAIEIVLIHMLKWDHQPERRSRSWLASIIEHRLRIVSELQDSPSYKARSTEAVDAAYRTARVRAAGESGLPFTTFPEACPFAWDTIMHREHTLDN